MSSFENHRDIPEVPIDEENQKSIESLLYCMQLNEILKDGYNHEERGVAVSWTSYEAGVHLLLRRIDDRDTPKYVLFFENTEHDDQWQDQDSYITITPGDGVTSIRGCIQKDLEHLKEGERQQVAENVFRGYIDTYEKEKG